MRLQNDFELKNFGSSSGSPEDWMWLWLRPGVGLREGFPGHLGWICRVS